MGAMKRSYAPIRQRNDLLDVFNNLYGRQRNELLKALNEALEKETIDRQSYDEITNMLDADPSSDFTAFGSKLKEASEYFSKAVEGIDPKFKARRQTELLYKTITDQPGRRQFAFGPTAGRTSGSKGPLGVGSLIDTPNAGRRESAGLLGL